ncbi:MAG: hypothetical protein KIG88_12800 [Weeksellaceae bacterium]|nr:hypothetical protein [Weeksellaceae bacterium]
MIEILDNILRFQSFIFAISGVMTFGFLLFNSNLTNDESYEEKTENFIKLVSNKWFYIPFSILLMNFLARMVVYEVYDKKVYAEFISKIEAKSNHQIDFKAYEIIPLSKNSRMYTDQEFIIKIENGYEIELKRNIEDTLSYYIFVPKYHEASYNTIAYITKKPLQN